MRPVRAGMFLFLLMTPLVVSGQEPGPARLPLAITDKDAVDEWRRTIWDGPLDPRLPSDTEFLLSLTERGAARPLPVQAALRAVPCRSDEPLHGHVGTAPHTAKRYGARGDRARADHGGIGRACPRFKYTLDTATIDAIIAYLLKVERLP